MYKKNILLISCFAIISINAQKLSKNNKIKNDLYYVIKGKYEKDLCTPTNEYGIAICELYTFIIHKDYNTLKIEGHTIDKEIKTYSNKIGQNNYRIYDNNMIEIGIIYKRNSMLYFKYKDFLKFAEEKIGNKGYRLNYVNN